jgi:hypothetical protein
MSDRNSPPRRRSPRRRKNSTARTDRSAVVTKTALRRPMFVATIISNLGIKSRNPGKSNQKSRTSGSKSKLKIVVLKRV